MHRAVAPHQRVRQRHEAQAQAGRQRPCEGVHVDHLAAAVHRAQRRGAPAGKAELAVVIVLQDVAARLPRPAQQRRALIGAHLLAHGELARRRHIRRARAAGVQRAHVDGALAQRRGHDARPAGHQDAPHAGIARILHGEQPLPPDDRHQRRDQHLRARAQHDLLRRYLDAAQAAQHPGDLPAQRRGALRVAGEQQRRVLLAEHLAHQPRPGRVGKLLRIRRAGGEVPADRRGRRLRRAGCARRLRGDIHAAARAALAVALARQAIVSRLDRHRADVQVLGQLAAGGHACTRRQPPLLDLRAQRGIELVAERLAAVRIQRAGEHDRPSHRLALCNWCTFELNLRKSHPSQS